MGPRRSLFGSLSSIAKFLPSPPRKDPNSNRISLVPGLFLLTFVASVALLVLFINYITGRDHNTCSTVACTAFAELLKSSINNSISPCDNIGLFVCHGWRRKHLYSVQQEHFDSALATMLHFTESVKIPPVGQNGLQQVAAYYRSCHQLYTTDRSDAPLVRAWLTEAGVVWPERPANPNVLSTLAYLALNLSFSSIIDIEVARTSRGRATVLLKPALSFYYLTGKHISRSELLRIFHILLDTFPPKDADTKHPFVTFQDILRAEVMIGDLTRSLARSHQQVVLGDRLLRSTIEWNSTIARFQRTGNDVSFRSWYPQFVETFVRLWKDNGEDETHLLLSWHAMWFSAYFARGRFRILSGIEHAHKQEYQGTLCLEPLYLSLGDVLFTSYSALVFPPRVRRDVKELVLSIREAFTRSLNEDPRFVVIASRLAGWASVKHIFSLLDYAEVERNLAHGPIPGLPDFGDVFALNWRTAMQAYRQYDQPPKRVLLSGTLFRARLFQINAENHDFILVPVALTYPMYDLETTASIKYGGLGSHVALASARIVLGLYEREGGDVPAESRQVITTFRQCLEGKLAHENSRSGNRVVDELLALIFLLDAYSRSDNDAKFKLEALPAFSPKQVFFLTWCFMRCTGSESTPIDADPCSPVLRHVKAFAEAFECAEGTGLNPARRCELFPHLSAGTIEGRTQYTEA